MALTQEQMYSMVCMDVQDSIADVGVQETAKVYGVSATDAKTREEFINLCVVAELNRCYA